MFQPIKNIGKDYQDIYIFTNNQNHFLNAIILK